MKLMLAADLSELNRLHAALGRFAEENALPHKPSYALELILEELFTNVVKHGLKDTNDQTVTVEVRYDGRQLTVEMIDAGRAFNPSTAPTPDVTADLDHRSVGGLGLYLVFQFVEELRYRRQDERNRLWFSLPVSSPAEAGPEESKASE